MPSRLEPTTPGRTPGRGESSRPVTGPCPRCGGAQYRDADRFGAYEACLRCGAETNLDRYGAPIVPLSRDDARPRAWVEGAAPQAPLRRNRGGRPASHRGAAL